MFSGDSIYLLPIGVGKNRLKLLNEKLKNHGASIVSHFNNFSEADIVLVDDDLSIDRLKLIFANFDQLKDGATIVRTNWLSQCLGAKERLEFGKYAISRDLLRKAKSDAEQWENQEKHVELDKNNEEQCEQQEPRIKKSKYVCETSSSFVDNSLDQKNAKNSNEHIASQLQVLADGYKSTNDKWRAFTYEKAIETVKRQNGPLESREQCLALRGIGKCLADKIFEIIQTNRLSKAEHFVASQRLRSMKLFTDIWGAGPVVAERWYAQGLRTLDDVRDRGRPTKQQKIGLKYYDDLLERMSRREASRIVEIVKSAVFEVNQQLIMTACGSYRRQKETCGDVDILITHRDDRSREKALGQIVAHLKGTGFLTDDLVECGEEKNHKKYMGVCILPNENEEECGFERTNNKHRRIDIITVPYGEYATALIYFTGSAHFTRSMNAKAKSLGMRLNQHSLRGGVMRQGGQKLNQGYPIETATEVSVFEALGLTYLEPVDRDHT